MMIHWCKLSAHLQEQPLKGQAGVPTRKTGVSESLGCGQAKLQHPAVALQGLPTTPEQLYVGTQLLRGHTACKEGEHSHGHVELQNEIFFVYH